MIIPKSLTEGSTIAVVSPSSIIKPQNVYKALPVLNDQGWKTVTGEHAFDRKGTFAGTPEVRYSDFAAALRDPEVNAILCSRGGYGAVYILEQLNRLPLEKYPKWVIGYSDISAIHALLTERGIASIHAPMAKHIADYGADDPDTASLFAILRGEGVDYHFEPNPLNHDGEASGLLVGGNLSVIADLIGTPYDVIKPGRILFIEDVNEPLYKIDRMIWQLKLSGVLDELAGLIVGKFHGCAADNDFSSASKLIANLVKDVDYPVAFDIPIGHVRHNVPLICGMGATLTVTPEGVSLVQ